MKQMLLFSWLVSLSSLMATIKCSGQQDVIAHITARAQSEKYTWIGSDDGVWMISKKTSKRQHLTTSNSLLPSNKINCICIEPDGNVWIGTPAGILRYDNFTYYLINSQNNSLPSDDITAIASDGSNVWIGTANGGLIEKLQYGRFITYNIHNSKLLSDSIYSITADAYGNIWVGALNSGLVLIHNDNWLALSDHTGFPGKNIRHVDKENAGYFIYCANGDVYSIADGKITKTGERTGCDDGALLRTSASRL